MPTRFGPAAPRSDQSQRKLAGVVPSRPIRKLRVRRKCQISSPPQTFHRFNSALTVRIFPLLWERMVDFSFPFPLLCVDIGGTNARFVSVDEPGGQSREPLHLRTADFVGLVQAVEFFALKTGHRPRSMIVCGAGPVINRSLKLTNAAWVIDGPVVAEQLGLDQGLLLNDFEAQALSLPVVRKTWAQQIGPLDFGGAGPQVILGPGTGLGIGALLNISGKYTPVSSEACHIDFGPLTDEEREFWPLLERAHGRITTESVISGPGLVRVHNARMAALGKRSDPLDSPGLVSRAQADPKGEEAESLRRFWTIVARFAGDMAITFVAEGGVTLAGGVLPRIIEFLDDRAFRAAFEAKAPVERLARSTPTRLLTRADSVLAGMAAIGADPKLYLISYEGRRWR